MPASGSFPVYVNDSSYAKCIIIPDGCLLTYLFCLAFTTSILSSYQMQASSGSGFTEEGWIISLR